MRVEKPLIRLSILGTLLGAAVTGSLHHNEAKVPEPLTPHVVKEDAVYFKQAANREVKQADRQHEESEWINRVYPVVKDGLIKIYEAQRNAPESVKIAFTDFVKPNEFGEDMGKGPALHVVKSYDHKLPNGKIQRIYVNEHWPLSLSTGKIMLPTAMRARVQAFDGNMHQTNANDLFATDALQITWKVDENGEKIPLFARQHFYGDFDRVKNENPINQTETFIDAHPYSCQSCHDSTKSHKEAGFSFASIFTHENRGRITQDEEFSTPVQKQKGYERLRLFLDKMILSGKINTKEAQSTLGDLENKNLFIPPNMAIALSRSDIPWLNNDFRPGLESIPSRFLYDNGDWAKAIYGQYRSLLQKTSDRDVEIR